MGIKIQSWPLFVSLSSLRIFLTYPKVIAGSLTKLNTPRKIPLLYQKNTPKIYNIAGSFAKLSVWWCVRQVYNVKFNFQQLLFSWVFSKMTFWTCFCRFSNIWIPPKKYHFCTRKIPQKYLRAFRFLGSLKNQSNLLFNEVKIEFEKWNCQAYCFSLGSGD